MNRFRDQLHQPSNTELNMFGNLLESASRIIFAKKPAMNVLLQTRTKIKTNKSAAKRLIRTSTGLKARSGHRNHGNGKFTPRSMNHFDGTHLISDKGQKVKKLSKFLP